MISVFITGGTSGIGLELAKFYLKRGDRVGVTGRDLSKVPSEVKSHFNFKAFEVDVKDSKKMDQVIHEFSAHGLEVVVANAGRSDGTKASIPDFEKGRDIIQTNVIGVINTFEPALKFMLKKKKGHLVAVSSVAGFMGLPGSSFYSSSKAAVTVLCESLRLDLKKEGISVTTICPGFIDTPLTRQNSHPMPFLMSSQKAAKKIARAIDRKKDLFLFPFLMKWTVIFLNKIPRWLYLFIMRLPFANYTKKKRELS